LRAEDFLAVLIDILPLVRGSGLLWIFADTDPDPGSQNVADTLDLDPQY